MRTLNHGQEVSVEQALATLSNMLTTYARPTYIHPRPMPQADIDARWQVLREARHAMGLPEA